MSEADTPNNQPLPEPTASMDDSAAELADETETTENPPSINLVELPTFKDFVQQSRQEQTSELVRDATASSSTPTTDDPGIKMPDASVGERTKDADWFALAQKMRQRNRRLLEQVAELRQDLKENQEALRQEQMRSRDKETLLVERTEEFNTLQEQLGRLFQALESSHQAAQRQQILIETLSEQLQSSQERLAQLERECTLTQQRYNDQSHQLLQATNTCRELRTRLHRQQRQTLQFKAALEKSLEMHSSRNVIQLQQPDHNSSIATPPLPKGQPIQPWSAEPILAEETSEFDTLWNPPVQLEPILEAYSSQLEPFEVRQIEETEFLSAANTSDLAETMIEKSGSVSPTALNSDREAYTLPYPTQSGNDARTGSPWEYGNAFNEQDAILFDQADDPNVANASLSQTFRATPGALEPASASPQDLGEPSGTLPFPSSRESADTELELEQQLLAEMTSLAEASGLSAFQSDWSDAQALLTPDEYDAPVPYISEAQENQSLEDIGDLDSEIDTPIEELWGASTNRDAVRPTEVALPQSNWPSPVLYPLRPPKKRKSLAAIELPSFPRHRPV